MSLFPSPPLPGALSKVNDLGTRRVSPFNSPISVEWRIPAREYDDDGRPTPSSIAEQREEVEKARESFYRIRAAAPILTGALRRSIYKQESWNIIDGGTIVVGAGVDYASYVDRRTGFFSSNVVR